MLANTQTFSVLVPFFVSFGHLYPLKCGRGRLLVSERLLE